MKNAIKKIAAVAMAFTLLGTGTTIAKTVNPQAMTALTAHAACNHVPNSNPTPLYNWTDHGVITKGFKSPQVHRWSCSCVWKCTKCGATISSTSTRYYRDMYVVYDFVSYYSYEKCYFA